VTIVLFPLDLPWLISPDTALLRTGGTVLLQTVHSAPKEGFFIFIFFFFSVSRLFRGILL
jgi:hypothetical protein